MVQALASRLVLLSADGVPERPFPMNRERLVVGRSPDSDVVLAEPQVSRHHAELRNDHGRWVLRDLGSTAGTTRAGRLVDRPVVLHHGDVIGLGPVRLWFEEDSAEPPTTIGPAVRAGLPRPRPPEPTVPPGRMDFGPIAGSGNEFVIGTKNFYEARQSFLRDVAATRTRARVLIWLGVVLMVAGIATVLVFMGNFFGQLTDAMGSVGETGTSDFIDEPVDFRIAVAASGAEILGLLMIIIGTVLHVVATARRKDVDRKYPVTPRGRYR